MEHREQLDRGPVSGTGPVYISTPIHDDAVARLRNAIDTGKRHVLLRAKAGLGKSMVLKRALAGVRNPGRRIAVASGHIDGASLWGQLAQGLGRRDPSCRTRADVWRNLCEAVHLCRLQGLGAVLAIEDDHTLVEPADRQDLERLVNLAAYSGPDLTIVRVGRSMSDPDPRGDCDLAIRLSPLSRTEAADYLRAKFAAGGRHAFALAPRAATRLHANASGVPRELDRLASMALWATIARGLKSIPPEIVDEVASEGPLWPGDV
jgi:type II secretory pathway predicted ATPase ExeA